VTVHVKDASRAVGVVTELRSASQGTAFVENVRAEQHRLREEFAGGAVDLVGLAHAREHRLRLTFDESTMVRPSQPGVDVLREVPLAEIVPYIDWTPFFHAWEMKGVYPRILEDETTGPAARDLFEGARTLLDRIVSEGSIRAHAVWGIWPAVSAGDDIELYADREHGRPLAVLHGLRQQRRRSSDTYVALGDLVAPRDAGVEDWVGAFAVSTGEGVSELAERFVAEHDDYNAIMVKALADRFAEALAEMLHQRVRRECGIEESWTPEDLIAERYRGIRPAPGYPAQPDHTEKRTLWRLLEPEKAVGLRLTETCAMDPGAAVSGLYLFHPEARYFAVGKIGADQVEDYARRKGEDAQVTERALRPILGYDPD